MINDIISDGLTRVRNAAMRKLDIATLVHSKLMESVLVIFQDKGYIENFDVIEAEGNKKTIKVVLKYNDDESSVITEVKKVSKPGRRVYKGTSDIKKFKNGYGTTIVSTSKGVLNNDKAHELGVGGEVICTIW